MKNSSIKIIQELTLAYAIQMGTVQGFMAGAVQTDVEDLGYIRTLLRADLPNEITHAQKLGRRIAELGDRAPRLNTVGCPSSTLDAFEAPSDAHGLVRTVIAASNGAMDHYRDILQLCKKGDLATVALMRGLIRDKERLCQTFERHLTRKVLAISTFMESSGPSGGCLMYEDMEDEEEDFFYALD